MTFAVTLQPKSSNRKIAPQRQDRVGEWRRNVPVGPFVSSTYVSIAATCPSSCAFKGAGCYVQSGATVRHAAALDEQAKGAGMSALDVIRMEANVIDRAFVRGVPNDGARGGRDLRLHVGGDVSCTSGALLLGAAARRWRERGGGRVWTYTHRWRDIASHAWGPWLSVLASAEGERDAFEAWRSGYAVAMVVPEFPRGHRAFTISTRSSLRAIPCPAEAGSRVTCSTCRLCMDDVELRRRRLVVAFAAHGTAAERVRLAVLR